MGERVTRKAVVCSALAIAGVVVVVLAGGSSGERALSGDLLAVVNLVSWAAFFLVTKHARKGVGTLEYLAAMTLVAAITVTPIAFLTGQDFGSVEGVGWLWLVLLVFFVVEMRQSTRPWTFAKQNPAVPLLLISPAFLFLDWDAVWFVLVNAAYVFELRRHSAGDGFTFSFALIAFVGLLAAFTMVELENDDPKSQFRSPSDALYWAFGGLLRINTGRSYTPLTDDGRFLGIVVAVCGVIAASMFTAKLVTWVVGERKPAEVEEAPESAPDDLREQVAALQVEVNRLSTASEGQQRPVAPPAG
jgi:hypothetical protein